MLTTTPARRSAALAFGVVLALGVGGCDIHIDSHASPFASLSASDVARYRAAWCDEKTAAALAQVPTEAPDPDRVHAIVERMKSRARAWGPTWSFPSHPASAVPSPPPAPQAPTSAQQAVTTLATCAKQAAIDTEVADETMAPLLAAAAAARENETTELAAALGIDRPNGDDVEAATPLVLNRERTSYVAAPSAPTPTPADPQATKADLGQALAALDYARYRLEQAASHLDAGVKTQARQLADHVAVVEESLVASGIPDTRKPLYGRLDVGDAVAAVRECAADLARATQSLVKATDSRELRRQAVGLLTNTEQIAAGWGVPQALPGVDLSGSATVLPSATPEPSANAPS
ncbi:MAG: hypothetical protein Q4B10_00930 [Actinomycetaceae bacterium]|nr:hypothetical protein [Actinomycetaceae bacterium]